jgi:hypothetical protein
MFEICRFSNFLFFNNFVSTNCLVVCAVKSGDLEWLPEGSQLSMASPGQSGDKPKTFTSFSQSQKDILQNPLHVKVDDINIARLGPGQVCVTCFTGTIMVRIALLPLSIQCFD